MRLLNFRIRGAIGLKPYGEEVTINFENFDAGCLALVGQNGAGKTTILENLHPWPQLISRGGSLTNHFHLKDSLRELKFEYAGHKYFSKILIDGQRNKIEAYLYCDNEPVTDGKVPSYKDAVNQLFGSPEIFFKSIFFSQNGARISELTPGAKKEFFLGLLGLDRYERYVDHCKQQSGDMVYESAKLAGKIEGIKITIETNEEKLAERPEIEAEIADYVKEVSASENDLELARKDLDTAKEKATKRKQIQDRLDELTSEKESIDNDLISLTDERDLERQKILDSMKAIDEEISELQNNLAEADIIRQKADRLKELQDEGEQLAARKSQVQEFELKKNTIQAQTEADKAETRNEITIQENKKESLKKEIIHIREERQATIELLKEKLQRAEKTASELEAVPCKDTPEFVAACPLISSAREAKEKIEKYNTELVAANKDLESPIPETDELDKLEIEIEKNEHKLERLHPLDDDLQLYENEIKGIEFDADQFNNVQEEIQLLKKTDWQELLNKLDKAEITIEERRKKHEDLKAQYESVTSDYGKRIEGIGTKREAIVGKIDELEKSLGEDPQVEIDNAEKKILHEQTLLDEYRSKLAMFKAKQEALDQLEKENEKSKAEHQKAVEEKKKLDSDISDWKLLERAFGKNGLQALELDAACPEISNIATEIIQQFGRGWSISIRTVRASADAKKDVETFEIIISRSESEGVQNFDDLSGGEKIWVEEAIRKAVTIYLINHAGRDYKTIMQDEADGALDPERAEAFLDTTIKAHKMTGVHNTIIITQRKEIWERIPQRIHLDPVKGEIGIVV